MKRFFLFLVVALFFSSPVFSQANTDSLKKVVAEKKEKREKKEKEKESLQHLQQEKKSSSTITLLRIGADPQNIRRNIDSDEMLIRYDDTLLVSTGSGSGKKSLGVINRGEPLVVKIHDFLNKEIKEFWILQCGNDTEAPVSKKKAKTLRSLEMSKIIPIQIAGRGTVDSTKKDTGGIAHSDGADSGTIFRVVPEDELRGMLKDFFDEYSSKNTGSFPAQKESSISPWPYIVLGIVALAAGTYIVIRAIDKVPDANSGNGGGNGNGNGGGPVDPPSNGPVRYPVGLHIGFSL